MSIRHSESNIIAVHPHSIEEFLRNPGRGKLFVLAGDKPTDNSRRKKMLDAAQAAGLEIVRLKQREFEQRASEYGVALEGRKLFLVAQAPAQPQNSGQKKIRSFEEYLTHIVDVPSPRPRLLIALHEVSDPQNLGAVIRVADQFQADAVLITKRRSASVTSAVSSAAVGADRYIPVFEQSNLVRALQLLKEQGFWIYGADMDGESCASLSFDGDSVLVFGSEGSGLGRLVRESCDIIARIPTGGNVDSLNVGVAAGVLAYEVRRQQGFRYE